MSFFGLCSSKLLKPSNWNIPVLKGVRNHRHKTPITSYNCLVLYINLVQISSKDFYFVAELTLNLLIVKNMYMKFVFWIKHLVLKCFHSHKMHSWNIEPACNAQKFKEFRLQMCTFLQSGWLFQFMICSTQNNLSQLGLLSNLSTNLHQMVCSNWMHTKYMFNIKTNLKHFLDQNKYKTKMV